MVWIVTEALSESSTLGIFRKPSFHLFKKPNTVDYGCHQSKISSILAYRECMQQKFSFIKYLKWFIDKLSTKCQMKVLSALRSNQLGTSPVWTVSATFTQAHMLYLSESLSMANMSTDVISTSFCS